MLYLRIDLKRLNALSPELLSRPKYYRKEQSRKYALTLINQNFT